ncbi:MAG: pirin family protein [Cyclobacteriaceae bacterium]
MSKSIISVKPLGFPWETSDPFLFCVHHADFYPKGNEHMGPDASLAGRNIGNDFTIKDGWRMYHGSKVPGFPAHPHRGFETVTIVTKGLVDHSDSLGAAGRFGNGDVQWMTAGKGVQHSEMFPLLSKENDNPLELFQIWLNLPKKNKLVEPHFAMLWNENIPQQESADKNGAKTSVKIIAGRLGNAIAPDPAPNSWANDKDNDVAIWIIKMEGNATFKLPKASVGINRTLYLYGGESIHIDGESISNYHSVVVRPDNELEIKNGVKPASILLLQGKPIDEPVAQYGPFVMNTQAEIQQAMQEYQQTEFGGWPWGSHDHVHPRERGRFAKHADGIEEVKD